MKRYYPVNSVFGVLVLGFALTLLVPLVFSWYQDDGATTAYDEAFLLTLATGAGLWWATRHEKRNLQIRDGFLLVVLVWTILPVFAALPLVPHLGCSLTDFQIWVCSFAMLLGRLEIFTLLVVLTPAFWQR